MSDDQPTTNTTASDSPAEATPQRKPKTSPVGRILIGILLLILAVEAVSHFRMTSAKTTLNNELAKSEAEEYQVTRADVKRLLGGREPDLSKHVRAPVGDELYDVYYYFGILKRRVLCVHYGIQGETDADESKREMMEVLTVVPEVILYDENQ